jgi:hypothetical protein
MPQDIYKFHVPKLSGTQALKLCQRIKKKFSDLDFDRALERRDFAEVSRCDLHEVVAALQKLEERLEWGV